MNQRQQTFTRIIQALATIVLAWMSLTQLSSAEFYVAPNGDDSRTAIEAQSLSTPWKTIQKAASTLVAGDTCLIRAGTYRETVTVANSGTATAPIVFTSYNNEVVTISGTEPINTGWAVEPSFGNGHVYVTTVNLNQGLENQIFVNGVMQPEAQWPNPGQQGMAYPWRNSYLKPSKDWSYVDTAGYGSDTKGWFTDAELPNRPDGYWVGSRVMMLSGLGWIMWTPSVTAYEAATKKISTSLSAYNSKYDIVSGNEYHFVGVKHEMDTPGEWFYEGATQKLFIYTSSGLPVGVEAKKRPIGFDLSGRSFVRLDGLAVFGATIKTSATSAHLDLNRLHISYLSHSAVATGKAGLALIGNAHVLRNCDLGFSSSVVLSVIGSDVLVVNNWIHDGGYHPTFNAMVEIKNAPRILVSHNTLSSSGRPIIDGGGERTIMEYNIIRDGMRLTTDGAAVNSSTDPQPAIFHHNLIHGVQGPVGHTGSAPAQGIYRDSLNSNWTVHHNVIWDISGFALMFNNRQNFNLVFNNTLCGDGASLYSSFPIVDNTGSKVFNNVLIGTVSGPYKTEYRSNVYGDPGLMDLSHGDFRLAPGSSAIDAGLIIPGITDGYHGAAPDLGALESGGEDWTGNCGHDFSHPVQADTYSYVWPDLPYANRVVSNSSFESGLTDWSVSETVTWGPSLNAWTNGQTRTGLRAVQCATGASQISRTITGLLPNRVYRFFAGATGENASVAGATVKLSVQDQGQPSLETTGRLGDCLTSGGPINAYNVWYMNVLPFLTGPSSTSATIMISVDNPTSDKVYLDDVAVMLDEGYETQSDFQTLYWTLNEGGSNLAADRSGKAIDGILTGGPTWTNGVLGSALHFNGINQYIVSAPVTHPTTGITVACWAKSDTDTWNQSGCLVSKRNVFVLGPVQGGRDVVFQVYLDGSWRTVTWTAPADFNIQQWHHYAGSYDKASKVITVLVDGQATTVLHSAATALPTAVAAPVYVGWDHEDAVVSPRFFHGCIDEVRITSRALAASEITDLVARAPLYQQQAANTPPAASEAEDSKWPPRCAHGSLGILLLSLGMMNLRRRRNKC